MKDSPRRPGGHSSSTRTFFKAILGLAALAVLLLLTNGTHLSDTLSTLTRGAAAASSATSADAEAQAAQHRQGRLSSTSTGASSGPAAGAGGTGTARAAVEDVSIAQSQQHIASLRDAQKQSRSEDGGISEIADVRRPDDGSNVDAVVIAQRNAADARGVPADRAHALLGRSFIVGKSGRRDSANAPSLHSLPGDVSLGRADPEEGMLDDLADPSDELAHKSAETLAAERRAADQMNLAQYRHGGQGAGDPAEQLREAQQHSQQQAAKMKGEVEELTASAAESLRGMVDQTATALADQEAEKAKREAEKARREADKAGTEGDKGEAAEGGGSVQKMAEKAAQVESEHMIASSNSADRTGADPAAALQAAQQHSAQQAAAIKQDDLAAAVLEKGRRDAEASKGGAEAAAVARRRQTRRALAAA